MGDGAAAIPEQFGHILDTEAGGAQHQTVAGVEILKFAHQFIGRKAQQRGHFLRRRGAVQVRQFRMPFG